MNWKGYSLRLDFEERFISRYKVHMIVKMWNNNSNEKDIEKEENNLYLKITENVYNLYQKAIFNSFQNYNEVIKKIEKYGSFRNTFMVDIGDTDIDICIVPNCSLPYFQSNYLEKLEKGITN